MKNKTERAVLPWIRTVTLAVQRVRTRVSFTFLHDDDLPILMHCALLLSDIVTQIFTHFVVDARDTEVDAYTLTALSIVNRALSEHALDLLWARVDAWPLISLVSSETWTMEQRPMASGESLTTHLLHSRFFHYSKRVKTLKLPGYGGRHVEHPVLREWQRAQAALFPKLHGLDLNFRGSDAERAAIMWSFLAPGITDVRLSMDEQSAAVLSEDALEALAERCTHITRFCSYPHGRVRTKQVRVVSHLLCASSWLRHVHTPHVIIPAAVLHLATCPHLRTVQATLQGTTLALPAHSFPAMERPYIEDDQDGSELINEFMASQAARAFRDVRFSARMPLAAWGVLTRHLSLHTRLTHIYLDPAGTSLDSPDTRALADLLAPLVALPLESVTVVQEVSATRFQESGLSEDELLSLLSQWPRLRWWMVLTAPLSLSAFVDVLELCPRLRGMTTTVSCAVLPSEDAIARVERLDHPFATNKHLMLTEVASLEEIARVIARTIPHVERVKHLHLQRSHGESLVAYATRRNELDDRLNELIRSHVDQRPP